MYAWLLTFTFLIIKLKKGFLFTISVSPIRAIFIYLLSAYSAEMEPRIEILHSSRIEMVKLVCGENFASFGHSGHELQRFRVLVFTIHFICMEYTAAVIMLSRNFLHRLISA